MAVMSKERAFSQLAVFHGLERGIVFEEPVDLVCEGLEIALRKGIAVDPHSRRHPGRRECQWR